MLLLQYFRPSLSYHLSFNSLFCLFWVVSVFEWPFYTGFTNNTIFYPNLLFLWSCLTISLWSNTSVPSLSFLAAGAPSFSCKSEEIKLQGSYRQVCVQSRTFQGLLKDFPTVFKDWKLMKNTDLHIKILFLKCLTASLDIYILDNEYKIVVPLFGAAYAAPNKGTTILYWLRSPKKVLNPPVNGKIQELFKPFECFSFLFKANLIFKDFSRQTCTIYSSTFQACANLELLRKLTGLFLLFSA